MGIIQNINQMFQIIIKSEFLELVDTLMLNNEEQVILRLRYIDKMTALDIANALNKKESYINKQLFTLRKKLSKLPVFQKDKFNPLTATELQIRDKCRQINKSKEYADFCVMAFVEKLPNKVIAEKYCLTVQTVKIYKNKRKKELSI